MAYQLGNRPGQQMTNYKFLSHIVLCNVFFAIICIPTAGKLVDVAGVPLSISIYYFPSVYIFADILTEVYGYAVARRVLYCWQCRRQTSQVFQNRTRRGAVESTSTYD